MDAKLRRLESTDLSAILDFLKNSNRTVFIYFPHSLWFQYKG